MLTAFKVIVNEVTGESLKNDRKDDRKEITERQQLILNIIKSDDRITVQLMTEKLKVSEKTIRRELSNLQEKGVLVREGGRKSGKWVIAEGK